ncbi:MAG: ATP-binding protein, partial [Methylotenera sp.]|nr:ATP-binding protein [Methylotenera sp.]
MKTRFIEQEEVVKDDRRHTHLPPQPRSVDETGLSFQFLVELLTKALFLRGQMRLMDLVAHSKLSVTVLEPLLAFMRT